MIDYQAMFLGAFVCAACTLIATLAARPWRADASTRLAGLPAIGLGVGFLIAMYIVAGDHRPTKLFPPVERWHWIFWAPVPVVLAGLFEWVLGRRGLVKTTLCCLAVIAGIALAGVGQIYPAYKRGWHGAEIAEWPSLSILLSVASTMITWLVASRLNARTAASAWFIAVLAGAGACAFLSKFGSLGNAATMLVPGAGVLMVSCFVFPKHKPGLATWAGLSILSTALVSAAIKPWYGSMEIGHGVLLLLAPLGALAGLIADRSRWWAPPLVAALTTIAIACWPIGATISGYLVYEKGGMLPW